MREMKASLFWAIAWGIIFILSFIGIWYNFAQILNCVISAVFCAMFIVDYRKSKHI